MLHWELSFLSHPDYLYFFGELPTLFSASTLEILMRITHNQADIYIIALLQAQLVAIRLEKDPAGYVFDIFLKKKKKNRKCLKNS